MKRCLHFVAPSLPTQEWAALHQLYENDLRHALHGILEEPHAQFEFTKRAVDEFGRQLKKLCDKDITSFSQSGKCVSQSANLLSEKQNMLTFWSLFTIYLIKMTQKSSRSQKDTRKERHGTMCSKDVKPVLHSLLVCLYVRLLLSHKIKTNQKTHFY